MLAQVPVHGLLLYNSTRVVTAFTMEDLKENLISYQHDQSETLEDSFSFTVTDGTHADFYVYPETASTTRRSQTMNIEVIPVDNGIPQVGIACTAFCARWRCFQESSYNYFGAFLECFQPFFFYKIIAKKITNSGRVWLK